MTTEEVRTAALRSLRLTEAELGTARLTVTELPAPARAGHLFELIYGDSGGTFEGHAVITPDEIDIEWYGDEIPDES
jgi:hypothetical protein